MFVTKELAAVAAVHCVDTDWWLTVLGDDRPDRAALRPVRTLAGPGPKELLDHGRIGGRTIALTADVKFSNFFNYRSA